jgi:nitrite reductase/ring-hydroxylating ferredoxin subunit
MIKEETKYLTKFDQMNMVWKKVAEKGDIPAGKSKEYNIDGKRIAIFNQEGYHALDALCVHQDGSIVPGKLEGYIVECPLHFWHYNIKTGELLDYLKGVKLQKYPVEARNDGIYLDA